MSSNLNYKNQKLFLEIKDWQIQPISPLGNNKKLQNKIGMSTKDYNDFIESL